MPLDPIVTFVVLFVIGLLPVAAVLVTSFTKLIVVFGILRLALGIQQVPPTIVLNALSLVLTAFIMAPVFSVGIENAKQRAPLEQFGKKFETLVVVGEAFAEPLRGFLDKQTPMKERAFYMGSTKTLWPPNMAQSVTKNDLLILIPAFVTSELTQAFKIGFALYLAFLVVDLLVSTVLLALGMQMTSPATIAVPFKLLLFTALDGWSLLIQNLVVSYADKVI
jgi:type III secretion protein R